MAERSYYHPAKDFNILWFLAGKRMSRKHENQKTQKNKRQKGEQPKRLLLGTAKINIRSHYGGDGVK